MYLHLGLFEFILPGIIELLFVDSHLSLNLGVLAIILHIISLSLSCLETPVMQMCVCLIVSHKSLQLFT